MLVTNVFLTFHDIVHEQLEPSDIEVTQSYYEGFMDVLDLFPQNAYIPNSKGTDDAVMAPDIPIVDVGVNPGQDIHYIDDEPSDHSSSRQGTVALESTYSLPPPSRQDKSATKYMHRPPSHSLFHDNRHIMVQALTASWRIAGRYSSYNITSVYLFLQPCIHVC
ncbi:hypothetical protein ACOSQ2_009661 [Xanthoceras sorbifolium]